MAEAARSPTWEITAPAAQITAATQTTLMFNGTIRVIAFDGKLPSPPLKGKVLADTHKQRGGGGK